MSLLLTGVGNAGTAPFIGPLDGLTTGLKELWGTRRLVSSYEGALFTIRVDVTGQPEYDIPFMADGKADTAAILAVTNNNTDPWYITKKFGQLGFEDTIQTSAANQPQGGIDGDGNVYAFAPGAGFLTTSLLATFSPFSLTDSTSFAVHCSTGFALDAMTIHDDTSGLGRRMLNFGSQITNQYQGTGAPTGTEATINSTNTGCYATVLQYGASGNRLNNGTVATGTKPSATMANVSKFGLGWGAGGPFWVQNARIYAGGLYTADIGNTNADALQVILKDLFNAQ